jgi:hypothetical protein
MMLVVRMYGTRLDDTTTAHHHHTRKFPDIYASKNINNGKFSLLCFSPSVAVFRRELTHCRSLRPSQCGEVDFIVNGMFCCTKDIFAQVHSHNHIA